MGLFTLLISIVLSSVVFAEENNGFPGCGIYSDAPIEFTVKEPLQQKFSDDPITIQCGAAGNTWNGIKSPARFTNDTGRVLNYEKVGGISQRNIDFNKMPGKVQNIGDGVVLKKLPDGRTLTSYTSRDGHISLSFPSTSKLRYTDKIRYK